MSQDEINSSLQEIINEKYNIKKLEITLTKPKSDFGDYSTNLAFILKDRVNESVEDISNYLSSKLTEKNIRGIKKVECKSGFINIYLDNSAIIDLINKKSDKLLKNKNFIIDHTDPNPFKLLHIGHLVPNAYGSVFANIARYLGANVVEICYQGDIGPHIAKAVWALKKMEVKEITQNNISKAYQYGSKEYENEKQKKEIDTLNKNLYDENYRKNVKEYIEGKKVSLQGFSKIYERLNTKFQEYIFETDVIESATRLVHKGLENSIFLKDGGAIIFPAEKYNKNYHTRVFYTQNKVPTYDAKEMGLIEIKQKYKPDISITVTGKEQNRALEISALAYTKITNIDCAVEYIGHGLLKLKNSKMSSRDGTAIPAKDLLDQLQERIKINSSTDLTNEELVNITLLAIRYSILSSSISQDIIFDEDKSISVKGNSGVYILYTIIRFKSLLKKAGILKRVKSSLNKKVYLNMDILRKIEEFDGVVVSCFEKRDCLALITYITQLASMCNSWYEKDKIINADDESEKINLVKLIIKTFSNYLFIMGVKEIERI